MKKSRISLSVILCMIFVFCLIQPGFGQGAPALEVADAAICQNIENRACVDAKEEFPANVDKLYCLTRINGAAEDTEVTHVWYYGDTERFRISLPVRSISWRTYSSKTIQSHETGKWRVEVLGPGDKLLKTISFSIVQ
jgi:hypothetical protein